MSEAQALQILEKKFSVSRETIRRLELFQELLHRWSKSINLVARDTLPQFWSRHVLDSFGLLTDINSTDRWLDMGSGGGFPLIPIAIFNSEKNIAQHFIAIESDQRKSAFLFEARRQLSLDIQIIPKRIEDVPRSNASVISARALADVGQLLGYAEHHTAQNATILLLKGQKVSHELTTASSNWHMSYQIQLHSLTARGSILRIDEFARA